MTIQDQQLRQFSGLDNIVTQARIAAEWGGFGFPLYAGLDTPPASHAHPELPGLHAPSPLRQRRSRNGLVP